MKKKKKSKYAKAKDEEFKEETKQSLKGLKKTVSTNSRQVNHRKKVDAYMKKHKVTRNQAEVAIMN